MENKAVSNWPISDYYLDVHTLTSLNCGRTSVNGFPLTSLKWSWNSKCFTSRSNRQRCSFPSHPIAKPKQPSFHTHQWLNINSRYFYLVFFSPGSIWRWCDWCSLVCCWCCQLLLVCSHLCVTPSGDKHLIRVCASLCRHAFLTYPCVCTESAQKVQTHVCTHSILNAVKLRFKDRRFTHKVCH